MIEYRQVKNEPQKQPTRKKFLTITSSCDNIILTKQRTTQQSVKALQTHIVVNSKVFVDNHKNV